MKLQKVMMIAPIAALLSVAASGVVLAASKDAAFIKTAASANMLEIKAGQLAQNRATSADWKKFGGEMVTDHTTALAGIKALAKDKNVAVSSSLAPPDQANYRKLSRLHGVSFDKAYSKFAVKSHEEANGLYSREIAKGRDSDVRAVASKQLPTVQNHLQMADKMAGMSQTNLSKGTPKP